MSIPSIVFLATPDFTGDILEYIIDNKLAKIKALWTKPSKPQGRGKKIISGRLMNICQRHIIPVHQPEQISQAENLKILRELKIDLAFVVAYGQIIKPDFYLMPTLGTYNLHFSILPKYRGASPVQTAILAGETSTGVTIQEINSKMDEGDIILQSSFDIKNFKASEVFKKSTEISLELIKTFLQNPVLHRSYKTPQNHTLATYCSKIEKQSGWIQSITLAPIAMRKFLAFDVWPGVFFTIKGDSYQLVDIDLTPSSTIPEVETGYLNSDGKKRLWLQLPGGHLEIRMLKKRGKKTLKAQDFLNGAKLSFPVKID